MFFKYCLITKRLKLKTTILFTLIPILFFISGCTNQIKGIRKLVKKDQDHSVKSTNKINHGQNKKKQELTLTDKNTESYGFLIENSGKVKVHSNDKINVQVKDSPVSLTFKMNPSNAQKILQIASSIDIGGDENVKKTTASLLKKLIYSGVSSLKASPGLLNGASTPGISHKVINNIKQIDLNAISIKKNKNGIKILNPGSITVGTNDDIDISVINSPITINLLLGNSSVFHEKKSNAQQKSLTQTNNKVLNKTDKKSNLFSEIPLPDKISCLGNQSCIGKFLFIPFQLFGAIKQIWQTEDKTNSKKENHLNSRQICDQRVSSAGLISALTNGISITNKGEVGVISKDKVNVRLTDSPINIHFEY